MPKKTQKSVEQHEESMTEQLHETSDKAEATLQKTAEQVEAKMDEYADKLTKKVQSKVDSEVKKKAKNVADRVESVAGRVEDVVNEIGTFIPNPNKVQSHAGIDIHAKYHEEVSRLFIFRFLWLIVQGPVIYIWSIWIALIGVLQILHMLIFGKRNDILRSKVYRYMSHTTKRNSYIMGFVDEQPKIIEDMPKLK
ncbi:MAG: DUF4389 domain-containing protein [Candidatus Absconditabacterales bacterium]